MLLIDRTVKSGKFEFFVMGIINENMTAFYPFQLRMNIYYNPAPVFEPMPEGEDPREPMYLLSRVTDLDKSQGKVEVKTIESPLIIDYEGDLIDFEFSGYDNCPAISCEGFGGEDPSIIDHFRCKVREKDFVKACNGTWNINVDIFDDSIDPKFPNIY